MWVPEWIQFITWEWVRRGSSHLLLEDFDHSLLWLAEKMNVFIFYDAGQNI